MEVQFTIEDNFLLNCFQLECRNLVKSDVMSDLEDTNVMLRNYGTNEFENS